MFLLVENFYKKQTPTEHKYTFSTSLPHCNAKNHPSVLTYPMKYINKNTQNTKLPSDIFVTLLKVCLQIKPITTPM